MKTNSKQVREQIRLHILEVVTDNEENYYSDFEQEIERVKSEFHRVADYPWNLKRLPNNQERFSDYLRGLPFNFHISHYDVKNYLNDLGINPEGKEYDSDKSLHLYHYLIFREIFS